MGEFLYFLIYVAQQLGIMLGVGAQTVLLCAHLIAVHHGEQESPHAAYAQAARKALGAGGGMGIGASFLITNTGAGACLKTSAEFFESRRISATKPHHTNVNKIAHSMYNTHRLPHEVTGPKLCTKKSAYHVVPVNA